jgi:hypothetical protein
MVAGGWVLTFALLAAEPADATVSTGAATPAPSASPVRDALAPYLPPPVSSQEPPPVYQLRARKDGKYEYESTTFAAIVDRDGSVEFRDHHAAPSLFLPYAPLPEGLAGEPGLEGSVNSLVGRRRIDSAPMPASPSAISGTVVEICNSGDCFAPARIFGSLGATFDVTDELLRGLGEDPYRAEKARFLAATSDWRLERARLHQARLREVALDALDDDLARAWADQRFVPSERRRLLFYRWLEMDDSPEGKQGAAIIESFIRQRLPAGSPDGFTAPELQGMAKLAAPRRFAPYAR